MSTPKDARQSTADHAHEVLAQPIDVTDGTWTADSESRKVSVVVSTRLPAELAERLFAEAERRGVTPNRLVAELVEAARMA